MKKAELYIAVTLAVLLLETRVLPAQSNGVGALPVGTERVRGIDRWAFRVNALELLCTVPNINAEFALSSSPYGRMSAGLTVKYNWNTRHSIPPSLVFNMFELRPEVRRWYRTAQHSGVKEPAKERAFFWGGYLSGGSYSIKPGTYGIQGPFFSIGALWGFDFPLYTYRHFSIDFELGIAAGLGMTAYDSFTMNRNGSDYVVVPERSRGMHLCPFPVVSEMKACFVFRTLSVKDKYKKVDARKLILKQEKEDRRRAVSEKRAEERRMRRAARRGVDGGSPSNDGGRAE